MSRPTRKILDGRVYWDTKNHSWDASIYSSGGVTYTVWVEAIDENGKAVERYNKTFTGQDSRQRAWDYANLSKVITTDPQSIWETEE